MGEQIRVATYNLYLGADLEMLLLDESGRTDPQAAFEEVQRQLQVTLSPRQVVEMADFPPDVREAAAGFEQMQGGAPRG